MLKLTLTTALSTLALVSIPQLALAQSLSETSGHPAVPTSNLEVPFCYLQTQQRVTFDLSRLCGTVPAANNPGVTARTPVPSGESGDRVTSTTTYVPFGASSASIEGARPETLRPEMLRAEQITPFGDRREQQVEKSYPSDSIYVRGHYRSSGVYVNDNTRSR